MKLIFYLDYDKFGRRESPAILPFLQMLRDRGSSVEFAASERELLEMAKKGCDAVAISVFSTLELKDSLRAAIRVKKTNPRIVILLGGQGVVGNAESLINALGIDIVIEGEGELVLPLLLEHLRGLKEENLLEPFSENDLALKEGERDYFGEDLKLLLDEGIFYRSPIPLKIGEKLVNTSFTRKARVNGKTITLPVPVSGVLVKTYEGPVLRAKPDHRRLYVSEKERWGKDYLPSYEAFLNLSRPYPTEEELNELILDYPWDILEAKSWSAISLYTQRGCNWGQCSYCGISSSFGRRLSPSRIIQWLKEARKRGIAQVTFEDDQFLQSPKWIKELCGLIVEHGLNRDFQFGAMVRVDSVKGKEMLEMLKEANFVKLQVGVESLLPEKIRYFRKTPQGREGEYVDKAVKLINHCLEIGIQPGVFIITSRPKESGALLEVAEELKAVSRIISSAYEKFSFLPTISFNDMLMAYPGAPLLETEEYKRIILPLGPVRTKDGIALSTLKIPYIFEFKSIDLANFIGNLFAISKKRGVPPEVLNEALEHIEDIVQALEVSAQQLTSEVGLALRIIEASKGSKEEISKVLRGEVKPADVFNGVNLEEYIKAAEDEKERILKACDAVKNHLIAVEEPVVKEVNSYLNASKEKLKALENTSDKNNVVEELENLRNETSQLFLRTHPCLRARNALEALLSFMDEFETMV
jgi:radical SAM superfamily enzyme YgiQ (UPF0313 family)